MQDSLLKKLWEIRFQKIFDLEVESQEFYKKLLEENKEILQGTKAKTILEKIMKDEEKHAKIAKQLLELVKQKKVEDKEE